jgi:putative ABC transport system ATP-binding protein
LRAEQHWRYDHIGFRGASNREIGFIFQSFNLIGDLTVWENVELPLTYRGLNADEPRERVNEALAKAA